MKIKVHVKRLAVGAYTFAATMALIYVLNTYDKLDEVLAAFVSMLTLVMMYLFGVIVEEWRSQTNV